MIYSVQPNQVTKINETSGTIQNTDQIGKIELSNNENFTHSILLYPYQKISFNVQLYARLFNNNDFPVELRTVPFAAVDGGGSVGGSGSLEGSTVIIDGEEHHVITSDDFNSMLDDLGL